MSATFRRLALLVAFTLFLLPAAGLCQTAETTDSEDVPQVTETIQVTATRVPEDVEAVPASVTVVSGDEMRARGATNLATALAMVAGVSVAPGGDGGPAGFVPELWGLREFDAFLLVVDNVPWGGAFNPALTTLDLTGVDRIEVMRGPAPVLYGATSFVGVIHVLHRDAGAGDRTVSAWGGSYSSGGATVTVPLSGSGSFQHNLVVSGETQGFADDRTGFDRGHVLWRGFKPTRSGAFHIDFDGTIVNQDPASPHPRQGRVLSPSVPLDANHNPRDAKIDEDRLQLSAGYDHNFGSSSTWATTLAITKSERDTLRGFLSEISSDPLNAHGFEQDLSMDDVYFDSHAVLHPSANLQLVGGLDYLFGRAEAKSEDFLYSVPLNGGEPDVSSVPRQMEFDMEDERNFGGLYLQAEWTPTPRWRVQAGARLNHTKEEREAGEEELAGEEPGEEEEEEGRDSKTVTRGSGSIGASWLAWQHDQDGLWIYADWRDSYKPAALDFGPEAEPEILEPETAESVEFGIKGRQLGGRLHWDLSAFQMDFENLVVSQAVNGLPTLVNAGSERFKGVEMEADWRFMPDLIGRLAYSWHEAKFVDSVQLFDGVPLQLAGNKLEMSAEDMGGAELTWYPASGFNGSVRADYIGERFLNKRNTAPTPSFTTYSAGIGYRFPKWELRLQGENLTDERDPIAESELGDAQYYRQPARNFRLSWGLRF